MSTPGIPPRADVSLYEENERLRSRIAELERALSLQTNDVTPGELEALYATVPAGLALVDAALRYVRLNQRMAEINGVAIANSVGRKVSEVLPDLWPQLQPLYRQAVEERRPVHDAEIRGFTADRPGVERHWLVSCEPVSGGERFAGISVLVQEVTGAQAAQRALKENAQLMQRQLAEIEAIYASAPIGLCVFDDQLRWTRINDRMAELNGLSAAAHIGKRFSEIVPDLAEQCEAAFRTVMETGRPLLDFELSGHVPAAIEKVRYWSNRWVPLKDEQGRVVAVSVAIEEITERRHAEESLRQSERLYRAIGEPIDYGVWVCSPDGRNTYASPSFLKLVGLTQEQCSNFGWTGVLHPEDAERTTAAWQECVRTQSNWDIEHRYRGVDGQYYTILARGTPVRDEHGKIVCWAGINLDISRLKRAEERLREGQKLESIGLLAGGVAHDFNNMLLGIIGNASLAQDLLPSGHPAASFIEEVVKAGEQAAHLTRQLLAYSGKGRFIIEPLHLSDLISEMKSLVKTSIPKKIALRLHLERELPPIQADVGQMQQVVMNLVLNAAEAIGSDSGEISVRTGVLHVDERFAHDGLEVGEPEPGKYVFLEVRDSGCGMDSATKARIFDPFFSTKFTGRGLGLAALGGIVRSHQGAVKVTTRPGSGSSFTVLFPASEAVRVAANAPAVTPALRSAGTILVVDDEETVRRLAAKTLERAGFKVLVAASGPDAIDLYKRHPGDVTAVILDLSMPGMSGQEALPELRKIRPDVPVIVSSGYSEDLAIRLFQGQRVSAFLQKPYTASRLAALIASTLR